jgi:predicted membrane protein
MGGCEIDLTQASMAPGHRAVVDCFTIWGGIEIKVPADWEVVNQAVALLGGIEDKTQHPLEPRGQLVVTGIVIMGGVEIKN